MCGKAFKTKHGLIFQFYFRYSLSQVYDMLKPLVLTFNSILDIHGEGIGGVVTWSMLVFQFYFRYSEALDKYIKELEVREYFQFYFRYSV